MSPPRQNLWNRAIGEHVGEPPLRNRKLGGQVRGQLCVQTRREPSQTNPKPVWPPPEETDFTASEDSEEQGHPRKRPARPAVSLTEIPLLHLEAFLVLSLEKTGKKERTENAVHLPFDLFSEYF